MRSTLLSAAVLALAACALGFVDDNNFFEGPGVVRFPLAGNKQALDKHLRRQFEAGLANRQTGFFYTIDLEIGTPPQTVAVNFDTGSSELWVNPNCAKSSDEAYCKTFGAFGKSASFTSLNQNATLKYGRGHADVEYGYDYVTVGTSKINQQIFGVAHDSEFATTGLMGVGPNLRGWNSPYPYIIDNLFTQKFINSRAFSLDLRQVTSQRGAVVFGGIDTKKFKGPLIKRDIVPAGSAPDGKTRYWATCDSITINQADGSKINVQTQPQTYLFDSGYTISSLPTTIFNELLKAFPSASKESNGQYTVDCGVVKTTGTLDFKFDNATIRVPYSDFIWQQPNFNTCVLGAIPDDKMPVLGDTFLRAAYVVYDWDNRALHFAAAADCGSNLVAIGSGSGAVSVTEGDCDKTEPTTSSNSITATSTSTSSTTATTSSSTTSSTTESSSTTTTDLSTTSSTTDPSTTLSTTSSTTSSTTESSTTTSATDPSTTSSTTPSTTDSSPTSSTTGPSTTSSSTSSITESSPTSSTTDPSTTSSTASSITESSTTSSTTDPSTTSSTTDSSTTSSTTDPSTTDPSTTDSSTTSSTTDSSTTSSTTDPSTTSSTTDSSPTSSITDPSTSTTESSTTSSTTESSTTSYTTDLSTTSSTTDPSTSTTESSTISSTIDWFSTSLIINPPTIVPQTTSSITTTRPGNTTYTMVKTIRPGNTTYTSMVKTTRTHTITSCAPIVTNCPVGKVTTEVITSYTTWCPEENQPKPISTESQPKPTNSGISSTSAYTKPPCPEVTLTLVIPKTYYCTKGQSGCTEGEEIVTSHPATIVPITPMATPTPIPGCVDCHPKQPAKLTQTPAAPAGVVPVAVNPNPVETKEQAPAQSTPAAPAQTPSMPAPKPVATQSEPVAPIKSSTLAPVKSSTLAPVKPSTLASVKPSSTGAPVASQPPFVAGAAALFVPGLAAVVAALVAAM
ncbi:hypothetical protein MY11210_005662 [Beauveria gryllotalpidicola]